MYSDAEVWPPMSIQYTCVICLPEERKTAVADFIMQRTISELDTSSEDVSERTITLDCGHIFTVETLDGHCHMPDFYEQDGATGNFTATKAPPINYQTPPSCPTCRGPISSLRYGRVTKRANLDILEQNVASTMSLAVEQVQGQLQVISSNIQGSHDAAKKLVRSLECKPEEDFERLYQERDSKFGSHDEPLPSRFLSQPQMVSLHGLATEEARAWNAAVRDILRAYRKVEEVAKKRGPHIQAYHAALSMLYRLEFNAAIARDSTGAADAPEPFAMAQVNKKIGQPPHKADTRFQIEAYLLSIELRLMLGQIAQSRFEALGWSDDPALKHHRQLWYSFIDYIFRSCFKDAEKAVMIATRSSASRQAARCMVYKIRSSLELCRFFILNKVSELSRLHPLDDATRQELAADVNARRSDAVNLLKESCMTYLRVRPSENLAQLKDERKWFNDNCTAKVDKYLNEYDELVEHIMTDKVYRPLSLHEREEIVKAFGFSPQGHFYNCENGHTFVITECGGAMEQARCPECSAPIGGSNHQLLSSNTRAMEFEEVARAQGM
ncbi:hypothetical protein EWM64_g1976 [Hericium alpestre]|uniref:RZ-type domain-containing protein n=1 Tax=Hericium alpestre TaxID=135208 RepID=A0A4Z0A8W9_9AGAM|nr:hypothetical protein EWM64_g1976 [Hericium alpestre]